MNTDFKTFFNKSLVALAMLLGVSPVFLLLGAGLMPDHPAYWYAFPCAAYLLGALSYLIQDHYRMIWTAVSALALAAASVYLLLPFGVTALFPSLAALIFLFLLPPLYHRPLGTEWSFSVWAVCLVTHLIANLLAAGDGVFAPARAPLKVAFALFAAAGALLVNYVSLRGGMGGDTRPPKAIRRRNMLATALLYAVALVVALWDTVSRALGAAFDFVKRIIFTVLNFIAGLFPAQEATGGGGGGENLSALMGEAPPEPSAFARLMEKIIIRFAIALAAACAIVFLYFIGKKLVKLIKKLLARLRDYASSVGEGYTDQAESTFSLEQWTRAARENMGRLLRRRERPTPWQQLDGRARVRRLYADYRKRHTAAPADTARETLMRDKRLSAASAFAALYDRARYSAHEISPADADALRARVADGEKKT